MKYVIITLLFYCSIFACYGQSSNDTTNLEFPDHPTVSVKFQQALKNREKEFDRLFSKDSARIKNYSPRFMLDKIDHDSNYEYVFIADYWITYHYKEIIPALIKRVTDKTEVGLVNSADLIIFERIQSGQMKFYGHGGLSADDLFTVAGRANRLLTEITGENFGHVSMYSTKNQLTALQKKWINWLHAL